MTTPSPKSAQQNTTESVLGEVQTRITLAERQGWTNRSVPIRLLRAVAWQLEQHNELLAAMNALASEDALLPSAHDHGNCELCELIDAKLAALKAKTS